MTLDQALEWADKYSAVGEINVLATTVRKYQKLMSEQLHVERLVYENGRLELDATHPLGKAVIASLVSVFVSAGAENYFEMNVDHPHTGPLVVTIQRAMGKSPGQIAGELREELRVLKESR